MANTFKLPLPTNVNPSGTQCIEFEIPDDPLWLASFWGHIEGLANWYTWEPDAAKTGAVMAAKYRSIITKARVNSMGNCKCIPASKPMVYRVFAGACQYSNDGVTFYNFPSGTPTDFGYNLPYPNGTPVGVDVKCVAAKNIVTLLKQEVTQWVNTLNAAAGVLGVASVVTGAASFILPAGLVASAVTGIAAAIAGLGATYIANSFTQSVYDDLECLLYTYIGNDASWTGGQFTSLMNIVNARTGDVWNLIKLWLNNRGPVGLTNSAKSAGITTCSYTPCADLIKVVDASSGTILSQVENSDGSYTAVIRSTRRSDGQYIINFAALNYETGERLTPISWSYSGATPNYLNSVTPAYGPVSNGVMPTTGAWIGFFMAHPSVQYTLTVTAKRA